MTRDVFRCDYCGHLADLDAGTTYYELSDEIRDDHGEPVRLWVPATYCSPYCGRTATSLAGSGRG